MNCIRIETSAGAYRFQDDMQQVATPTNATDT